jgi:hypothetical protein
MSTRSRKIMFLGNRGQPVRKADNLTAICDPIVWTMWDPGRLHGLLQEWMIRWSLKTETKSLRKGEAVAQFETAYTIPADLNGEIGTQAVATTKQESYPLHHNVWFVCVRPNRLIPLLYNRLRRRPWDITSPLIDWLIDWLICWLIYDVNEPK